MINDLTPALHASQRTLDYCASDRDEDSGTEILPIRCDVAMDFAGYSRAQLSAIAQCGVSAGQPDARRGAAAIIL